MTEAGRDAPGSVTIREGDIMEVVHISRSGQVYVRVGSDPLVLKLYPDVAQEEVTAGQSDLDSITQPKGATR